MKEDQLIKKDCKTGEYSNMFPNTYITNVTDSVTGESLDLILQKVNHLYLPFIDNRRSSTRLQVESKFRRKGLYITYESCKGEVITEYYNSSDFSDEAWGCDDNWVGDFDEVKAKDLLKELYSWYKS